mmetsp:Transcript_934/g.1985  ORF Transcript_934/g.1985 Transcript_934/m.1985 type:complete len:131 (-) Transcript_934:469-861(-)
MTRVMVKMGITTIHTRLEDTMVMEDEVDMAFRVEVEVVVDMAGVAVVDEAAAAVRLSKKAEPATQLQMQTLVTRKKGAHRLVKMRRMLSTIHHHLCKHRIVVAAEAMVAEAVLDAGVAEDAAEVELTLSI